jgi:hypothetical protein
VPARVAATSSESMNARKLRRSFAFAGRYWK